MSSSTSNSRRWLQIFFAIVIVATVGFLAASEWLIHSQVMRSDNFEWIAGRLRNSTQPNAAFGDSHVAAVPDFNQKDFINLGVGATTIRRMDQRVRYYFDKIQPGQVIIQADPHLFAEYRLQAQASYVPENYSQFRLRALDPRHRGFMLEYWLTLLARTTQYKAMEVPDYDALWQYANAMQENASRANEKPLAEAAPPASTSAPTAESTVAANPADPHSETMAKFNAFMDYEVSTHTPVLNFRERGEAKIYQELIKFLQSRGATVCLMNYPVDTYYRKRADAIPAFKAVRNFYQEVARENHIPYVSFWDRFDDSTMYRNTDHVNEKGSPILAREARERCFGKPAS